MNEVWAVECRRIPQDRKNYPEFELDAGLVFADKTKAERVCAEHNSWYHNDFEHRVTPYVPKKIYRKEKHG